MSIYVSFGRNQTIQTLVGTFSARSNLNVSSGHDDSSAAASTKVPVVKCVHGVDDLVGTLAKLGGLDMKSQIGLVAW